MVVGEFTQDCELLVIGGGPGGYTAAFRAAELGVSTTIVESSPRLGGVCLNCGCIPSKAVLHAAEVIHTAKRSADFGITFGKPKIDVDKLRTWKDAQLAKLAGGLDQLCKKHHVEKITGRAVFEDSQTVRILDSDVPRVRFRKAIIATGSVPSVIPSLAVKSPRLLDSTSALELESIPKTMLVIGGGYIGLELGTAYAALGTVVSVVEMTDGLMPGVDRDLVRPLEKSLANLFDGIYLETKVAKLEEDRQGLKATFEGKNAPENRVYDKVLMSVGRRPNTKDLGLENTQVKVNEQGFIETDDHCRTADRRIWAIGDAAGQPMLAHKAVREGKVAAEVIAGQNSVFDPRAIPAVVFTDPEIAYCGLTETEAKAKNIEFKIGRFPWSASGRALTMAHAGGGFTKVLFDPQSHRVLGVGIVGPHAAELIAEGVLAVEMGSVAEDLITSIHPHPTLSETMADATEAFLQRVS